MDATDLPVICAGGIADGRGVAAAFCLGAKGVQLGTRFIVANECNASDEYKNKVIDSKDTSTVVTGESTGHPVRVIKNKFAKKYKALEKSNATVEELESLGAGALRRAVVEGDVDHGSVMAGQSAGLVKKKQTSKEIIDELIREYYDVISNLGIGEE